MHSQTLAFVLLSFLEVYITTVMEYGFICGSSFFCSMPRLYSSPVLQPVAGVRLPVHAIVGGVYHNVVTAPPHGRLLCVQCLAVTNGTVLSTAVSVSWCTRSISAERHLLPKSARSTPCCFITFNFCCELLIWGCVY